MRRAVIVVSVAVAAVGVALLILHSGGGGSRTSTARLPPAKRILGPLHTDGKRLVGSNGPVRLLGLDEPGLVSGSGNNRLTDPDACGDGYLPVPDTEFDDFKRLGFNSVRLGVSWANMEPDAPTASGEPAWNLEYLKAVDDAVRGVHLARHRRDPRHAREQPVAGVQEPQARAAARAAACRYGCSRDAARRTRRRPSASSSAAGPCPARRSTPSRDTPTPGRRSPAATRQQAGRGSGHLQRAERGRLPVISTCCRSTRGGHGNPSGRPEPRC